MGPDMGAGRCAVPVDLLRGLMAVGLLLGLGLLATLRPLTGRQAPLPIPHGRCEAWMADAIPRVGVRKRDAVAAAIRNGEIPPAAQEWFSR